MKSAASDLVNIVVWADQSKYTSRIAITPFAYDVRLPSCCFHEGHRHYADGTNSPTCVVERTGSEKYTDAAPQSGQYVMVHNKATTTTTTTGKGKNKVTTTTTTYSPTCDVAASAQAHTPYKRHRRHCLRKSTASPRPVARLGILARRGPGTCWIQTGRLCGHLRARRQLTVQINCGRSQF